ncbi:EAL domain-containing protein [Methylicorpusculum sp.]|uniref:EAL domain-containing protein n=1 Tax=Methylicorpusculum sp. TaxID=2713644 RepID=UPI002719616C|nr:EAL domain-containing protein [Methylicorpusculum sp.]MDO8845177.1 EAL domain-containing protein [Methylicorpusculum sp.]
MALSDLFNLGEMVPHGFCIKWTPGLLWSYVAADTLIALSYFSIPFSLYYFVSRRKDLQFRRIFLMFSAFILACGTTHLFSILLLWQPFYWVDAILKAITAVISFVTAIYLARIIPQALSLPSPAALEREIEQRKQYQLELQGSESNLRILTDQLTTLIESIPDTIFFKDGEGRLLIANECARQLFKLHEVAWQGKTKLQLVAEQPDLHELYEKCFNDDESTWNIHDRLVCEENVIIGDGNVHKFEVRKTAVFNDDSERKGLVVIVRDITDRWLAERELRIAATTIESQEGIMVTDEKNRILRINRAFTRLTGYIPAEVIGKTPAILKSGRHDKAFYQAMWEKLISEKHWQGEVWDRRKSGEIYPKWLTINAVTDPTGQVTNYVGAFSDLSEHKDAEAAIHRLAFYDPLTDLPNRRLLNDRLELAMMVSDRNQAHCAMLLIDLDNFKIINDTKGHGIGDLLLIEVGKRLKSCVRQGDTVARLGGDEFVIMLENLDAELETAVVQAERVGEKIIQSFTQSHLLDGKEHHSSASIGISLFFGSQLTSEEIMKHADTAMYEAKQAGRNALRFFDPDMHATLEARVTLESDLRHALELDQLRLYYQLQIDNTGRVLGAEVLLRWQHPQHGMISPAQFIPIAEESGLIVPIGEWVLHSACMQLKAWENDPLTKDLHLAVNVSVRQFRHPNFVEQMWNILKHTGADGLKLKLELTESLVMQNVRDTIDKMEEMQLFGIHFSMDDFGTGYSSLSYLKRLPLSQLKIDQSFVRDLIYDTCDAAIIQTIIGMAHNLGLNVIAEGVETEEQRACLECLGCFSYQGYLFSKPVPRVEFEALLKARST